MKRTTLLSTLFASLLLTQIAAADTLALWTFETVPSTLSYLPGANTVTTNFYAEGGLQAGTAAANGFHVASSTYSSPSGNGPLRSLSANSWAVNDYYQFTLNTVGYQDIALSFDQTGSGTGPSTFGLFYSVNGGSYSQFGANYTVLVNAAPNPTWGATFSGLYTTSFNLSSVIALNQAATVAFRLVDMNTTSLAGGTVASGGTDRVDNFTVTALPVPEPAVGAILCGFGLLGLFMSSRRR